MDAVAYPDEKVSQFISENVIPLRVPADHKPLSADFNVQWTPALLVLDQNGKEHHRTVGFFGKDDLVQSIILGVGHANFNNGQFQDAIDCYDEIISKYPSSDDAPEAIFYKGVSGYKNTGNPMPLREAYDKLTESYPGNLWTKRAYPYRLIE